MLIKDIKPIFNTCYSISIPITAADIMLFNIPNQCHIGKISPQHLSYTQYDKCCHPCCALGPVPQMHTLWTIYSLTPFLWGC